MSEAPIPKSQPLIVLSGDDPGRKPIGWKMYENVGIGMYGASAPIRWRVVFEVPYLAPGGTSTLVGRVSGGRLWIGVPDPMISLVMADVGPRLTARFARGDELVAVCVAQRVAKGIGQNAPDNLLQLVGDAMRAAVVHDVVDS